MTIRARTAGGIAVLIEPAPELPVVTVGVTLKTGTLHDPRGKEGLTRLMGSCLRMGTRGMAAREVAAALDRLGGRLSISSSPHYVHLGGAVLAKNLAPYLELVASLLIRPALRASDLRQLKRETIDDLRSALDDDRVVAGRHFRRHALGKHLQARSTIGTARSLARIDRASVVAHHRRHVVRDNLLVSVAGPVQRGPLCSMLDVQLGPVRRGRAPTRVVPRPEFPAGRRVLLVDKPGRTQAQVLIGTLSPGLRSRDYTALVVANTAFGGLFTSRLMREVRSKRGWSYGASSGLPHGPGWDLWSMSTAPGVADARACIELQLSLYDDWLSRGLTRTELAATRSYLVKSQAFEIDTAAKRLDLAVDRVLFGLPAKFHSGFADRVRALKPDAIADPLRRSLSSRDQLITVVASADQMQADLEQLPGIDRFDVVAYDDL